MTEMEIKLQQMLDKVERKRHLDKLVEQLTAQQEELRLKCHDLNIVLQQENRDVDTLENSSIAGFFLDMFGKREEKLEKERREAYAAKAKYTTAQNELAAVDHDIDRYTRELETLKNCEAELQQILDTYMADTANSENTIVLQTQLSLLKGRQLEMEEAIAAGEKVTASADIILTYLDKADGWSTADFFLDSFLVDVAKHDNIDKATTEIGRMQTYLRQFKSELADVTIERNISISIDGFVTFADYFWDGIFSNLAVRDKIHSARNQVSDVKHKTRNTINMLIQLTGENAKQQQEIQQKLK